MCHVVAQMVAFTLQQWDALPMQPQAVSQQIASIAFKGVFSQPVFQPKSVDKRVDLTA